jgi:Rrf2 family protein
MIICIINIVNRTEAYRLEALIELAAAFPRPLTIAEIARRRRIPAPFLGRLLAGVVGAGQVTTARGPRGGVRLQRAPEDTRLIDVIADAAPGAATSPAVTWLVARLDVARRAVLESTTLAGLLAVERERRANTDWQI